MPDTHTPTCPRCGYDLSGPVPTWRESCPIEGTCSECGLRIRWAEAFAGERNAPSWHIEAHGLRWSMLAPIRQTLRIALPWRFWSAFSELVPFRPLRIAWFVLWPFVIACGLAVALWILIGFLNVIPAGMSLGSYTLILFGTFPAESANTFMGGTEYVSGFDSPLRIVVLGAAICPCAVLAIWRVDSIPWGETCRSWMYSLWIVFIILAVTPATYSAYGVYYLVRALFTSVYPTNGPPPFSWFTWALAIAASFWLAAYWFAYVRRYLERKNTVLMTIGTLILAFFAGAVIDFITPWDGLKSLVQSYYIWLYR